MYGLRDVADGTGVNHLRFAKKRRIGIIFRHGRSWPVTMVLTVIDYLDAIHLANEDLAATPFPHARWNNWFQPGQNTIADTDATLGTSLTILRYNRPHSG
ncbi:hypothetical protein HDU87_000425 [Geranomyces variabilis]|uniref:Uncharacterized protein n=1 Tax=Geranomyces variabilis TaxID=109894 RepID=A0AAD5TTH3_9FUNG|nr:hypothetical protein HDU87_000425 [Geranomyces variabilis]